MEASPQLRVALFERYLIEREIGAGAMATVYLARDVRYNRKVAVKVMKPELGAVLGTERFLTEIQVTANLQHPHLLPLFDSGEAAGQLFYVMPFVEGESLRERLNRERQLPVDEAVSIAVAVLSALDYAHRHGVIHRDLKPENILLHDGQPLVADFGIALAVSEAGGNRVTQTGWSLGTPQYMSPEQATGDRLIDARSDLYSLAAVLYEMLTGEPLHNGPSVQAVIANILTQQPQHVRHLRVKVPEHVDAAIVCALAKIAADRFSSAAEFGDALLGKRLIAGAKTHTLRLGWPRSPMRVATFVVAAMVLPLVAWETIRRTIVDRTPATPFRLMLHTGDARPSTMPGARRNLALSRDGKRVAFVGAAGDRTRIALYQLETETVSWLEGSDGLGSPVFSPNGTELLVTGPSTLKRILLSGGAPMTVLDGTDVFGVDWHERGDIVLAAGGDTTKKGIWRVRENGRAHRIATVDSAGRGHLWYGWPHILPDGKSALITIWKTSHHVRHAELGLVRLSDGRVTELGLPGTDARYVPPGYVVFGRWKSGRTGTLWAAPFSLRRRVLGPAVEMPEKRVIVDGAGSADFAMAENGLAVFHTVLNASELVRVNRAGKKQVIHADSQVLEVPRVSADGRRIALARAGGGTDIWMYDLVTKAFMPISTGGGDHPEWSPDGQRLLYVRGPANDTVFWKPWDGSGTAQAFLTVPHSVAQNSKANCQPCLQGIHEVSAVRPRSFLAVRSRDNDIWLAPPDSARELRPFLATPAIEVLPRLSPSSRLLAYVSDVTGRREVFITPIPGPGPKVQVSTGGGDEPSWAPNGRAVFYRSAGNLMVAHISESPRLDLVGRDTLFEDSYEWHYYRANYDVFPNGQEFVFVQSPQPRQEAVLNWPEEIRRRLAR